MNDAYKIGYFQWCKNLTIVFPNTLLDVESFNHWGYSLSTYINMLVCTQVREDKELNKIEPPLDRYSES